MTTVGERRLVGHGGGWPGHITRSLLDPVAGLAVSVLTNAIDGPAVELALGAVAHVPWRALRAEEALRGRPATEEAFGEAADAELAAADPLPENAFKVPLARRVIVRTLEELSR